MDEELITPVESLHLHEIIGFKVLCATKSSAMKTLVKDEKLKKLMDQDVTISKEHLEDLKKLIIDSPFLIDDEDEYDDNGENQAEEDDSVDEDLDKEDDSDSEKNIDEEDI